MDTLNSRIKGLLKDIADGYGQSELTKARAKATLIEMSRSEERVERDIYEVVQLQGEYITEEGNEEMEKWEGLQEINTVKDIGYEAFIKQLMEVRKVDLGHGRTAHQYKLLALKKKK